jgi:methyl-accepting chemotaxis protein
VILLAPVLALTDRLRTGSRLAALTVVLVVPGLVAQLSDSRSTRLAVAVAGLVVGVWVAAAVRWRARHDARLTVLAVGGIADGDLGDRPLPAGRDELGDIGRAVDTARRRLASADQTAKDAQTVREQQLQSSYQQQRDAERQLRERAQSVVDETTGVIVGELGEVVEQVGAVRDAAETIDERVSVANHATRTVVDRARRAEVVVSALEDSLRRVSSTVQLIAGIAGQTRLLALNATIEAARAGAAGRGFTVVASEVKDLADSTARSTEQIADTIRSLEDSAADMTTAIGAMVESIAGIDAATGVLGSVATDQRAVVEELNVRIDQTVHRIRDMSNLSQRLERRHAERISANGSAVLRLNGTREGHPVDLLDLSTGGMRCAIDAGVPLAHGDTVEAELKLHGTPVGLHARVLHREPRDGRVDLGLQFLAPDPAVAQRIGAYVRDLVDAA